MHILFIQEQYLIHAYFSIGGASINAWNFFRESFILFPFPFDVGPPMPFANPRRRVTGRAHPKADSPARWTRLGRRSGMGVKAAVLYFNLARPMPA